MRRLPVAESTARQGHTVSGLAAVVAIVVALIGLAGTMGVAIRRNDKQHGENAAALKSIGHKVEHVGGQVETLTSLVSDHLGDHEAHGRT